MVNTRTTNSPSASVQATLWFLGTVFALLCSQYVAGALFLLSLHLRVKDASPVTLARYLYYYGGERLIRERALWCSLIGFVLVLIGVGAAFFPKSPSLHGDATFATHRQIARAGLFGDDGILLGRIGGRYLTLPGFTGVSLAAPTRSGKGVSVVTPNLLHWPGSVVTSDPKREAWTLTAGYRQARGHTVYLFDPLSETGNTARWNPFTFVSEDPGLRINDVQKIASMFYPEIVGVDPFWSNSARSLFVGIALYLFETPSSVRTIGEVRRQGMADAEGFAERWTRIIEGRAKGPNPLSDECVRNIYDTIKLAPQTSSSIRKTFSSRLELWGNPLLDAATATSDFDLNQLRRQPMAVYVGVSPGDLARLRPLIALFFEQCVDLQTRVLPEHDPTIRYSLLLLLDEIPAFGRIPILETAITYLAGFRVRILMSYQGNSALKSVFGADNAQTMLSNLGARIAFAPKDYAEAKELADELGVTTVKARSHSKPRFGWGRRRDSGSVSVSDHARALRLPQEIKLLRPDQCLIFCEGLKPILAKKICYYRDRRFTCRLLPPPIQPCIARLTVNTPQPSTPQSSRGGTDREGPDVRVEQQGIAGALADRQRKSHRIPEGLRVTPPHGETWSEQELQREVERFLRALPTEEGRKR